MQQKHKVIQSLQRAFSIIDCFTEKNQQFTLNEISEKVNLNVNTTRGLIQTLILFNYISHNETLNTYRLGCAFLNKAELAKSTKNDAIANLIKTDMQKLADKYKLSVRLQCIDDFNIYTLQVSDPITTRYILSTRINIDLPFYASASGKLLLYYLKPEIQKEAISNIKWKAYTEYTITNRKDLLNSLSLIKEKGYSEEKEELAYGISSIAFPILENDKLIYTLSVTSNSIVLNKNISGTINELTKIVKRVSTYLDNF